MTDPTHTLVTLYRPVGQAEHDLVAASGWRAFPPRLPEQPIFYPVCTLDYAVEIARGWNVRDPDSGHVGYVTRFQVPALAMAPYPAQSAGGARRREHWIPAEDLAAFNQQIVGLIAVVATFRPGEGTPSVVG